MANKIQQVIRTKIHGDDVLAWAFNDHASQIPLAGLVSFSSEGVPLEILVGVEAHGRSYGSRVCKAHAFKC